MSVPEKFVVTFKPGKEMVAKVREMELRAAAEAAARNGHPDFDDHSTAGSVGPAADATSLSANAPRISTYDDHFGTDRETND